MVKGIYIHVPFCGRKCPYCDFYSVTENTSVDKETYIRLLKKEIEMYKDILNFNLKTVYIGGGTPSKLEPSSYKQILDSIYALPGSIEELSLECNPEDYSYEEFKKLIDLGFNRISFGVQTFSENGLSILGRTHSASDSLKAIEYASRAGFENINIDLIYGYPFQTEHDLKDDLRIINTLPINHISAYMLTLYENTPMNRMYKHFKQDDTVINEMHELIYTELKKMGFVRYEISNWAKKGYECKHNLMYWTGGEFLGVGVSAWSFVKKMRWSNVKNTAIYKNIIERGDKPVVYKANLKSDDAFTEYIILRLRTMEGVSLDFVKIPEHIKDFFEFSNSKAHIKEKFMIVANEIISDVLCYNKPPREELCWKLKDLHH